MYAIQIAEGGAAATANLFWYGLAEGGVDGPEWRNIYFNYLQPDVGQDDWSIVIDAGTNTATVYDGPNLSGNLVGQNSLPTDQEWHLRFIHLDGTSGGFPAGDNLLNLYSISSVSVPPPRIDGACCIRGSCGLMLESQCAAIHGEFAGDGTVCDDVPCPVTCQGDIIPCPPGDGTPWGDGKVDIFDILGVLDAFAGNDCCAPLP
ncbi:MAG: hypothetical protein HOP29_12355 [Phycisphaerales bacterium]|nr:hypothetical protein [Phycisphaerales bacterium]